MLTLSAALLVSLLDAPRRDGFRTFVPDSEVCCYRPLRLGGLDKY